MKKLLFLYNPRLEKAEPFARNLASRLCSPELEIRVGSVWEESLARAEVPGATFAVTFGGDGTVLRAARIVAPLGLPLIGVNLGKLGFLTELGPKEAERKLPQFVQGQYWTEERLMLAVSIDRAARPATGEWVSSERRTDELLAINDVVAGRAALARAVDINVWIDDVFLASYVADGLIVSTATGSTAYSLAAGGPILHPQLENLLVTPILPHLSSRYPLVLPPGVRIRIEVVTGHQAGITVDGQVETPLYNGDVVTIGGAPQPVRFLRAQPRTYFYRSLSRRLKREGTRDHPVGDRDADP